jgi:hypothetical protein
VYSVRSEATSFFLVIVNGTEGRVSDPLYVSFKAPLSQYDRRTRTGTRPKLIIWTEAPQAQFVPDEEPRQIRPVIPSEAKNLHFVRVTHNTTRERPK